MMLQAVAHDVKNKLAELAMRLMDSDIEAAALALDSADKLSQALLLDNPDQLVTQIDSTCPADLVEELSAVYAQLFPEKQLNVDLSNAPTLWYYDVTLMRLALSNVIDNALKHCATQASLTVTEKDKLLLFDVRNDGGEFPQEVLDRDWDTHVAVNTSVRKSTSYSTGMGLLLAHKIVKAHCLDKNNNKRCGFMHLSNNQGACVRLALP